jgi:hypothetical protein
MPQSPVDEPGGTRTTSGRTKQLQDLHISNVAVDNQSLSCSPGSNVKISPILNLEIVTACYVLLVEIHIVEKLEYGYLDLLSPAKF